MGPANARAASASPERIKVLRIIDKSFVGVVSPSNVVEASEPPEVAGVVELSNVTRPRTITRKAKLLNSESQNRVLSDRAAVAMMEWSAKGRPGLAPR